MEKEATVNLIMELSQGNFGAVSVVMEMQKEFGIAALFYFSMLKDLDLVGPRLWILYKRVAKNDINNMVEILMQVKTIPTYKMSIDGKETEVLHYINQSAGL